MSLRTVAFTAAAAALACLAAASGTAAPRVSIIFESSSNPGAGGLYTERLPALSGDTISALVVLTPDVSGVSAYSVSVDFDQGLLDGLDLLGATATPPPGWVDDFTNSIQESDLVQGGFVENLAATQGAGSPLPPDVPFPIAELQFFVNDVSGGPAVILPNAGHPGDGMLDAVGDPLASIGFATGSIEPFDDFQYAPSFRGRLPDYGLILDLGDFAKPALKVIGKGELPPKTRGVSLKVRQSGGFGFFQTGVEFASPITNTVDVDMSRFDTPGAFAGAELDSPYVPPGTPPTNFFFGGAVRESDQSITLFASDNGANVGTPISVPPGVGVVSFQWVWKEDLLTLSGGPASGPLAPIVSDVPFTDAGTAGFGMGFSGAEKKDSVGFGYAITGDVHDAMRQMILTDLQTIIDLEVQALADLDASMSAEAREKIESAKRKLETGEPIPGSDPPATTGGLIQKINGYFSGLDMEAVRRDIEKRLQKAAKKDGSALDKIDRGQTDRAKRDVDKALTQKNQAKAILETLVRGEGRL